MKRVAILLLGLALGAAPAIWSTPARAAHAIALHGEPKYERGFSHFDHVNPAAPRGGRLRQAMSGSFDSVNPFISLGSWAPVMSSIDTLLVASEAEASVAYGLLAREVVIASDGSHVDFELDPRARFHDGSRVTPGDVACTFDVLRSLGHPRYRMRYASVTRAEPQGGGWIRFFLEGDDARGLALRLGELPVLSQRDCRRADFDRPGLEPLLGSGPYRVERVDAGRSLVLERVRDYWGRELGVRRGQFNFDRVSYEYYRDSTASREALFADHVDVRPEGEAQAWARAYQPQSVPALDAGWLRKERIDHRRMPSVQTFAFNLRRAPFDDPRVRRAISLAFDFEWMNERLFFGQYERTRSLFPGFGLSATGVPAGGERLLLERFRGRISEQIFTSGPDIPTTDGSGYPRENLRRALGLLREAGYVARDTVLVHEASGEPLALEILLRFKGFERITLPFTSNLRRLGIDARVRVIDSAHYAARMQAFDFDLVAHFMSPGASPGRELLDLFGSSGARVPGTLNRAGIADPVVDELIELVLEARDRNQLAERVRALDRVLLWSDLFIPQWHAAFDRVVYWDRLSHPEQLPEGTFRFHTWWWDEDKASRLEVARAGLERSAPRVVWAWVGSLLLLAAAGIAARVRRSRRGLGLERAL